MVTSEIEKVISEILNQNGDFNKDTKIYRIFKWDRFFDDLLHRKQFTLMHPNRWQKDDPFENLMFENRWEYNPSGKSDVLNQASLCFIGQCNYLSEDEIIEFGSNGFRKLCYELQGQPSCLAHAFLIKRKAFRHENEVKLMYINTLKLSDGNGLLHIDIDDFSFLDTITLHPLLDDHSIESCKRKICEAGFTGVINSCDLYKPPKDFKVVMYDETQIIKQES